MDLYFMPSDIARIILGYLKENSYIKTYNCFLKECSHLRELYNLEKAGRSLKRVTQLSLIKIVEEWGRYKYSSEKSRAGNNNLREIPSSDDTVDDNLVFDNDVTSSGRKTKQKARSSNKKSPQVSKIGRSPTTPKSFKTRLKSPRKALPQNIESEKTSKDDVIKTGNSREMEAADDSPESTENITPTKGTPDKLEIHSPRLNFSEKSHVPPDSVSNIAVSNLENFKSSENRAQQITSTLASDSCIKTTEIVVRSKIRAGLSKQLQNEMAHVKICGSEQDLKKLTEQENVQISKPENNRLENILISESNHRNTEETATQCTDDVTFVENNKQKAKVMSETFIKLVVEPPSESVGSVEDKCLSWMTRNECENTTNIAESREVTETIEKVDYLENTHRDQKIVKHEKVQRGEKVQEQLSSEAVTCKSSGTASTDSSKTPGDRSSSNTSDEGVSAPVLTTPKKMSRSSLRDQLSVTPVKFLHVSGHNTSKSPRRKKPKTPRKRASEVSPVSVVSTRSVDPSGVNPIFEKILSDHRLHEKLAETCNLVHSQIKLASSGKEYKDRSDSIQSEQVSLIPVHQSMEQETVTASRSLEEILGIDHNFHTDLLSDNIDMSDPAYESLFKLFGTDRETFNEYLRKEKEKELALMEAEVEELERSNHEILCANFGVSQADAGYETQELAYNSPHHIPLGSQQDLFSSQHGSHSSRTSHVTSTPCGVGAPVNFTPLLRGNELCNSPVHSASSAFGCSGKAGNDAKKMSPCSTATQPFSPALSHYSEVNNPPTPRHQQHLTTYINGSCHGDSPRGPSTPGNYTIDHYSNPATPQQSSPQHSQLLHSTPTGSVRSRTDSDHFHQSSPIHHQHSAITNMHVPTHCSPLVKADLNPHSPFSTQSQTVFQSATNSGLYFNSQVRANKQNGQHFEKNMNTITEMNSFSDQPGGYLSLLNDDSTGVATSRGSCTTIENTIGCISLPQPTKNQAKSYNHKKGAAGKSRRKRPPKKRKESYAHLKEMLNKPLRIPNSVPLTMRAPGLLHLPKTPEKRIPDEANLTFRSPGGKTLINVPVLNCEDEIDLSILGMDDNVDVEGSQVVNVYGQNLDTSVQCAISPENQVTHNLVSVIQAGNTAEAVKQITQGKTDDAKPTKKANSERKSRAKKKKEEVAKDDHQEHFSPTPPSSDHLVFQQDGYLDPDEEMYTATLDTSIGKAATARALNFGPHVDNYRKIMPKPETGPSVLILSSKQVINPGQKIVVNTTPVSMMQNVSSSSSVQCNDKTNANSKIDELSYKDNMSTVKVIDISLPNSSGGKRTSKSHENDKKEKNNSGSKKEVTVEEHNSEKTPTNEIQSLRQKQECSSEKRVTRSVTLSNSSVKENQSIEETQVCYILVSPDKHRLRETPKKDSLIRNLCKKVRVNLGSALDSWKSDNKTNSTEDVSKDGRESHPNVGEISQNKLEKKEVPENDNKINKKGLALKTCRNKKNKRNEKLKVKLPVMSHRSPRSKAKGGNKSENSVMTFFFKKKTEVMMEVTSSDEDIPLSEVKKQNNKSKCESREQKEDETVEIISESESVDEKTMDVRETVHFTPKKLLSSDEDHTPSKEVLFEKIGLTPKKLLLENDMKSPKRANVLDVLAELQGSPASSGSCRHTSDTSRRFNSVDNVRRSPRTPRRQAHAKQLFVSPDKQKSAVTVSKKTKQAAKRVDGIIDRLKHNNPGRNLSGSRQTSSNTCGERDTKRADRNNRSKSKSKNANKKNETHYRMSSTASKNDNSENSSETTSLEIENEDPINDEIIKDNVEDSLLEENEQLINSDKNAFLSDGNSQDGGELSRAIASIEFDQSDTWVNQEKIHATEDELECDNDENTEKNNGLNSKSEYSEHSRMKQNDTQGSTRICNFVTTGNQDLNEAVSELEQTRHVISVEVHALQNDQDTCKENEILEDSRKAESGCRRTDKKEKHRHKHRSDKNDNDRQVKVLSNENSKYTSGIDGVASNIELNNTDSEALQEQILSNRKNVQDRFRDVKQVKENFNNKNKSLDIFFTKSNGNEKQVPDRIQNVFPARNPDLCEVVRQAEPTNQISVEIHAAKSNKDIPNMVGQIQKLTNPQILHQTDSPEKHYKETCSDSETSHINTQTEEKCGSSCNIEVETGKHGNNEEKTVNSEILQGRSKHKKKKHKHRHRNSNVDDQCAGVSKEAEQHHSHKKKKSRKRHREEGEDGRKKKRRRKEKTNTSVEMESLAAINIDDAITKIYGT